MLASRSMKTVVWQEMFLDLLPANEPRIYPPVRSWRLRDRDGLCAAGTVRIERDSFTLCATLKKNAKYCLEQDPQFWEVMRIAIAVNPS